MLRKLAEHKRQQRAAELLDAPILGDVVERTPVAHAPTIAPAAKQLRLKKRASGDEKASESTELVEKTWDDVVTATISRSFLSAQRALRETGYAEFADVGLRNLFASATTTPNQIVSAYRTATLVDRERLRRQFRLSSTHANPVRDEMSDVNRRDVDSTGGAAGIAFDVLSEEEIYNGSRSLDGCLSVVRLYTWRDWDTRAGGGGVPNRGGPLDERMGPVRTVNQFGERVACEKCGGFNNADQYVNESYGSSGMCAGHFGHIMMPCAGIHPFTDRDMIHMLQSFCYLCGSLPGDDAMNAEVVRTMYRTCETRVEKLRHLSMAYREVKHCAQCAKRRCCKNCTFAENDETGEAVLEKQCDDCAGFVYYRPRVRTMRQARNATVKLVEHLIDSNTEVADTAEGDEVLRAARGGRRTGFPCDIILNGWASTADVPEPTDAPVDEDAQLERAEQAKRNWRSSYARFAQETYGRWCDNTVLAMYGERVRDCIAMMSQAYLRLFFESALDTCADVLSWFRSFVPRVALALPNSARPTSLVQGGDAATVRTNDMTKRIKHLLVRCEMLSRQIDQTQPRDHPALWYEEYGTGVYESPRGRWFQTTEIDSKHIDLVGEVGYYFAAMLSSARALNFLPALASSHGIGNAAKARQVRSASGNHGGKNENGTGGETVLAESIEDRLHGKPGRWRQNLMGKRVENAARTVITPDNSLSIREVAVPVAAAARLVVKERVNAFNVVDLVTRAERARTLQTDAQPHPGCRGCAKCAFLAVDDKTELCIFNAACTERVYITGRTRLTFPVWQHPFVHEPGAVIERSLATGDTVLMNRQPSLHRHSMMAHRVKLTMNRSLGLHELITTPYNADFDGDEMNMHVPGSLNAAVEMWELMRVSAQFISVSDSAPITGLKQDTATGMYLLTAPDVFFTRDEFCDLMMAVLDNRFTTGDTPPRMPTPAIRYRAPSGEWCELWTGLQAASLTLPRQKPYLNYRRPANFDVGVRINYPGTGRVSATTELPMLIVESEILMGRIHSGISGAKSTSLTRAIFDRTGAPLERSQDEMCDWIDRCSWMATTYLTQKRSFSVGIGDSMLPADKAAEIAHAAMAVEKEIGLLLKNDKALMVTDKHADRVTTIEEQVMEIESRGYMTVLGKVEGALPANNAIRDMQLSGGKGKADNVAQIMGCLGGQQREGRRVVDDYIGFKPASYEAGVGNNAMCETTSGGGGIRNRRPMHDTLSVPVSSRLLDNLYKRQSMHEPRGLYPGGAAGGFVANSFLTGLTPQEFMAHAKSGREGLIDTAIKTSETGDAQRLAMKSCEDVCVRTDKTVRSCTNQLVSFRYGGNNYNPAFVLRKTLPFISMNELSLAKSIFYDKKDVVYKLTEDAQRWALDLEQKELRAMLLELRRSSSTRSSGDTIATPNNLTQVIIDVLQEMKADTYGAMWLAPADARIDWHRTNVEQEKRVLDAQAAKLDKLGHTPLPASLCAAMVNDRCVRWRSTTTPLIDYITEAEIRLRLCSKQVTRRLGLSYQALQLVLERFETALQRALIAPGESVGALMVQSIGQPSTQMTLNS